MEVGLLSGASLLGLLISEDMPFGPGVGDRDWYLTINPVSRLCFRSTAKMADEGFEKSGGRRRDILAIMTV